MAQSEKTLEDDRKKATQNNTETAQMEDQLSKINRQLGLTDVKGEGVIVKVDDNKKSEDALDPSKSVVHDGDLVEIVNLLKNGGAEAISINDQRITSVTAITCDGNVVRINGEKVGVPFEIKAIG